MSEPNAPASALVTRTCTPPAHPKETRQRALAMFQQGKPFVDIAFELKIAAGTLRAWASRENWDGQKQIVSIAPNIDAETAAKLAKPEVRPSHSADKLDLAEKQTKYQEDMAVAALKIAEEVRNLDGDELFARANKIKDLDTVARKALKLETEKPNTIIQIGLLHQSDSKQAAHETLTIDG